MKIYAIHSDPDNWNAGVSFIHSFLYHGEALLEYEGQGYASHDFFTQTMSPMRLRINGYKTAKILFPSRSSHIVIHEDLLESIRGFPGLRFQQVVFEKVINVPWALDNKVEMRSEIVRLAQSGHSDQLYDLVNHDEAVAMTLGAYYEVVVPDHYYLLKNYAATSKVLTRLEDNPFDEDFVPVSKELFRDFSMTSPGCLLMRDDLFDLFSENLPCTFFGILPAELV